MFMILLLTVALIAGIVWFVNKDKEKEGHSELAPPTPEKDGVTKQYVDSDQNR